MDNSKQLIKRLEQEIAELERDIHYVNHESSRNVLLYAREKRQEKLEAVKDRVGSEM